MLVPENVAHLCAAFLMSIRADPAHAFSETERLALLRAFDLHKVTTVWDAATHRQHLSLAKGNRALGWLTVLTAYYVLPVWEQAHTFPPKLNGIGMHAIVPHQMVGTAQSLLTHTVHLDSVAALRHDDFYYDLESIRRTTTEKLYCAVASADAALSIICHSLQSVTKPCPDFAAMVVKVYAGVDTNDLGVWCVVKDSDWQRTVGLAPAHGVDRDTIYFDEAEQGADVDFENHWLEYCAMEQRFALYTPCVVDSAKALAFWEWWLTDAIPHAWDLA